MRTLNVVLAVCLASLIGFFAGRLSSPAPVKATDAGGYVHWMNAAKAGGPVHGTPVAISCVPDGDGAQCYVLTQQ